MDTNEQEREQLQQGAKRLECQARGMEEQQRRIRNPGGKGKALAAIDELKKKARGLRGRLR
jgi:hypothetical protein